MTQQETRCRYIGLGYNLLYKLRPEAKSTLRNRNVNAANISQSSFFIHTCMPFQRLFSGWTRAGCLPLMTKTEGVALRVLFAQLAPSRPLIFGSGTDPISLLIWLLFFSSCSSCLQKNLKLRRFESDCSSSKYSPTECTRSVCLSHMQQRPPAPDA